MNTKDSDVVLPYTLYDYSSSSVPYFPENILEDKPHDQCSRWSSESNTPPQFLILKLLKPALLSSITFGKYEKTHVCNLKRFKLLGGLTSEHFIQLLDSGLKNDSNPETFNLKTHIQQSFPLLYIKIIPIQSWGPIFNFSIWHVLLKGVEDPSLVSPALEWREKFREREAIRLCLKHFRQNNLIEIFESLQKRTRIELESPFCTGLFKHLVENGNYRQGEEILATGASEGYFDEWINSQQPTAEWTSLIAPDDELSGRTDESLDMSEMTDANEFKAYPRPRGGHQMVIDNSQQILYLFGGWDGNRDLNDFWSYNILSKQWKLLNGNTEIFGGPSPRSCHKMVIDPLCRHIFLLGRYLERSFRDTHQSSKSDFYMYDIDSVRWLQITDDTYSLNGPQLIFDHQMCIDAEKRTIYVFGGQNLDSYFNHGLREDLLPNNEKRYSGLYKYYIPTNTWTKLREDNNGSSEIPGPREIRCRSSHSMLFHPGHRKLFIFGGMRKREEQLSDLFTYNVDTDEIDVIFNGNGSESSIPAIGHTLKATICSSRNEIHVMTGLNRDKDRRCVNDGKVSNTFWVYNIVSNVWTCFYRNDNSKEKTDPQPRHAHQFVYDEIHGIHYMFGGNPGGKEGKEDRIRLGDFWALVLVRPLRSEILRRCLFLLRKTQYLELIGKKEIHEALFYLQTKLFEVVNHSSESHEFQSLASQLFMESKSEPECDRLRRSQLFDSLSEFFPKSMTQPQKNLVDLIPYEMDRN